MPGALRAGHAGNDAGEQAQAGASLQPAAGRGPAAPHRPGAHPGSSNCALLLSSSRTPLPETRNTTQRLETGRIRLVRLKTAWFKKVAGYI